jgi:transcriptional regulator with PAS, ATPase and Fis domain
MISLTFIVPYEDLKPVIDEVLREYKGDENITASTFVLESREAEEMFLQGDVVISQGFTAQRIGERHPELVSVPLKVSGYDVIRAAQKAVKLYRPRKLALVGSPLMACDSESLNSIFETEIASYPVNTNETIPEAIAKAKEEGCDCFMGDLSLLQCCGKNGRAVMIETGKSSIIQSLDEAVRLARQTRIERRRAVGPRTLNPVKKDESLTRKKLHDKGLRARYTFNDIIDGTGVFRKTLSQAARFSQVECPVLITGESGTGKELLAQSIHNAGPRRDGPFVAVNCAALPENLLESELFGYSEGAFTGALKGGKPGLFELARGGSIFLDEISEIPFSFQSKLLRVLQENEVRRIGDDKILSVDIRVITATNRNLRDMTRKGLFRQDLLYRLDVLSIHIPPLRERPEDIIHLFNHYTAEFSRKYNKEIAFLSGDAKRLLEQYAWEGNVRELRNITERICLLNKQCVISAGMIREVLPLPDGEISPVHSAGREHPSEQEALKSLMEQYGGNRRKIAEHLNIDRSTLWRRLKKYRIEG